jgi:uncharacterized protein YuzE
MDRYRIEYDPRVDAAYIKIGSGKVVESTELESGVVIDLDRNKRLVGIEVLHFSKSKLDFNTLIATQFGNLASVVK